MDPKKLEAIFFLVILAGATFLVYFVFSPYLKTLIVAATFAIVFQPLYRYVAKTLRGGPAFSAFIAVVLILLIVLTPLTYLTFQVFQEAIGLYGRLSDNAVTVPGDIAWLVQRYAPALDVSELSVNLYGYIRDVVSWLFLNLGPVFSGLARFGADVLLALIALYYFLKDGGRIRAASVRRLPISDSYADEIFTRLELAVNSVIRGSLLVAVVQGLLVGVGFAFFGVPSPAFWGLIAVLAALIPMAGTAIITIPAVVYLFVVGSPVAATALLIWSIGLVGLVDNFLRPQLMKQDMNLHPLLVLLSVLGGLAFFGPLGFLLGPVTLSLFFALLDLYPKLMVVTERSVS